MEKLKGGASFRELAAGYSEDAETAPRGGDLGLVPVSRLKQAPPQLRTPSWARPREPSTSRASAARTRSSSSSRTSPQASAISRRRASRTASARRCAAAARSSCAWPTSPSCAATRRWSITWPSWSLIRRAPPWTDRPQRRPRPRPRPRPPPRRSSDGRPSAGRLRLATGLSTWPRVRARCQSMSAVSRRSTPPAPRCRCRRSRPSPRR